MIDWELEESGAAPRLPAWVWGVLVVQFTEMGTTGRGTCFVFFLNITYKFIYLFFGCVGSSFLCEGFLQLRGAGATLHRGARASHYRGLCCCGAQAPDAQAQQSWLTGPVAPRHVGSSQTRAQTRVSCISRQILNHCATREAPGTCFEGAWSFPCRCLVDVQVAQISWHVIFRPGALGLDLGSRQRFGTQLPTNGNCSHGV